MKSVIFISHWTQHTFPILYKLNGCGGFLPMSCVTANKPQLHQQLSEMSLKAKASICCYLCPPAVAVALCGMPAFSSDVTSSLHSVWIPMASSLFGCHTTLVLCYAGKECILGIFFSPPVCCLRVRGAINTHWAFMVRSCVAQQGVTHAAWLVLHSYWIHQSSCLRVIYSAIPLCMKYENR